MSHESKTNNLTDLLKTLDPPTNKSYGGKRNISKVMKRIIEFFRESDLKISTYQMALKSSEIEKSGDALNNPIQSSDRKIKDLEHIPTENNDTGANLS